MNMRVLLKTICPHFHFQLKKKSSEFYSPETSCDIVEGLCTTLQIRHDGWVVCVRLQHCLSENRQSLTQQIGLNGFLWGQVPKKTWFNTKTLQSQIIQIQAENNVWFDVWGRFWILRWMCSRKLQIIFLLRFVVLTHHRGSKHLPKTRSLCAVMLKIDMLLIIFSALCTTRNWSNILRSWDKIQGGTVV